MKQVKPCPFECNANDCKDCGAYTYSHHTQTNDEWRKICSAEEFAELMAQYCCDVNTSDVKEILKNEWMDWLKQPHKEDKHNEIDDR